MDLHSIYKALRDEYNGKLWTDEFLCIHIDLRDDQIICWFDLDEEDEGFEEKRDCAIGFYDEVVRFLVDNFGEEFKYEDPRISGDYIDRTNMYGDFEIVLDDDGENAPVVAIWENEENKMKNKFAESENHRYSIEFRKDGWKGSVQEDAPSEDEAIAIAMDKGKIKSERDVVKVTDLGVPGAYWKEGTKGKAELTEDAILDAIPVDARDGLIDINEPDGSFGRYTWYAKFAPFSDEEAKEAADGIAKDTGRRTKVASAGREIYVLIMDYPSRPTSDSKKLVKEGPGAGYTVHIKDLKFGDIISKKLVKGEERYDDYYECKVKIVPGEYEIGAEDYYNDFFRQEHEWGETPKAGIDGGVATIWYSTNSYDEDEADEELRRELSNVEMSISFMYGWGWMHSDLPKHIEVDHVDVEGREFYGSIEKLELNAPDLAAAVNCGYQSIFDDDEDENEDEDEDEEQVDESMIDDMPQIDPKAADKLASGRSLDDYDDDFGDGEWHVFDYGEDYPYVERYTVIAPDGYEFFIDNVGGVGSFDGDRMSYSTSDEMCDSLAHEIDGEEYLPVEVSKREISDNRIIQKGLKLIKAKYEYEDELVNEVSGGKLEDEDLTLVNTERDGDKLYIVKLWWGSGYQLDCYNAYANSAEEALNYVVAYIEKEDPGILERSDDAAATLRTELADEKGLENSLEAEDLPEFQETFMYVDAILEGALHTHYIWSENLQIAEYPKEHNHPMSKGIGRMNESYDDEWSSVGAAFEEFRQRLWKYTRQDRENRMEFYQDCMKKCEEAFKTYHDVCVAD